MSFPVARCAILKDPGVPGYTSSVSGSERMLRGGGGLRGGPVAVGSDYVPTRLKNLFRVRINACRFGDSV